MSELIFFMTKKKGLMNKTEKKNLKKDKKSTIEFNYNHRLFRVKAIWQKCRIEWLVSNPFLFLWLIHFPTSCHFQIVLILHPKRSIFLCQTPLLINSHVKIELYIPQAYSFFGEFDSLFFFGFALNWKHINFNCVYQQMMLTVVVQLLALHSCV